MLVNNEIKLFWLVVWNQDSGDVKRAWTYGVSEELASELFELTHEDQKVIHIGEGKLHPKSYRSLETV
ncbi:hypothetical protein [Alkalihalobacillus sp. BA299]|uniref:hypothetical protein n=1 Tax=Alkalihalobacillus sp. BA299 TaxID=2815938 RepID=UPI001ADC52DC|nr:hypothetical protein [Alkalihalobacillus sp. BA299]